MGLFYKSQLEKNVEAVLENQNDILANQARFLADNDKQIKNQKTLIANHTALLANQQQILANQTEVLKYLKSISATIMRFGTVITENQRVIEKKINVVESAVYDLLLRSGPGLVTITVLGENWENGMAITFKVDLPPKSAPDVVSRKLTVKIGDAEAETFDLGAEDLVYEGLEGPQDATVEVSLIDVDDAGNESGASTATAVLTDTVAPPTPGTLGIVVLDETFDPPVDPEPSTPPDEEPTTPVDEEPTTPVDPEPTTPVDPEPTTPVDEPTTPVDPEPTTPVDEPAPEEEV